MTPKTLLVRFCLMLESSPDYLRAKGAVRELLEDPTSRAKRYFDLAMILVVLASVALLVYSVENKVAAWMLWFEYFAVTLFILEYLARLWISSDVHAVVLDQYRQAEFLHVPFRLWPVLVDVARRKWAYVSSPLAIIDLLAILPSYRPVRLLRVFLLFRLFKLFRYARSVHGMTDVLAERRFEFYVLAFFMVFVVLAAASAIYVFEGAVQGGSIDTFFDAVYWSMVTLSTVGYGDITPHTTEGRVVALALIVSGIGVLAFTTSIVVAAFQEKLGDLREHRVFSELERGSSYTVIYGFGEVGQVVAAKLWAVRQRFVVVDIDESKVRLASKRGYLAVQGDAADNGLLEGIAKVDRAHTLVCVTNDDVKNVFLTVSARQLNDGLRIIARAGTKDVARKLVLAGANHTVSTSEVVGLIAAEYVGRPTAFEAIYGILRGEREVALEAVRVEGSAPVCGHTLAEVDFVRRKLLLFGVITVRDWRPADVDHLFPLEDDFCFIFKPSLDFRIEAGDTLVVFGYEYSLVHFRRELGAGQFRSGMA
ncbi:MAG: NAD-binding protein [Chromatiaceae bacterium]|nr:NAD-binding protein [Gammaproteobacteria bacterium]MCP5306438.1 NAD-binding protein [Chromatiaceae bacterium]MCP5311990.1 NAD-binding protein [Chromatiaceae bacterium]